jgi:hypothetical protein
MKCGAGALSVVAFAAGCAGVSSLGFASSVGGCGRGAVSAAIPQSSTSLSSFVRVWLSQGSSRPEDLLSLLNRAPDYQASEPLAWTVIQ